jgi:hypothetical protein
MLAYVLYGLAALVAVLVVVIATRPPAFRVARTAKIAAPAGVIFSFVNDFREWPKWSPFVKYDPQAKLTYEGPATGVGSVYKWDGNKQAGSGIASIIESRAGELVTIKLEFLRPFKATNTAEFTFRPEGDETLVTWSMHGKNNFMAKAFHMIVNCEKMIGGDFEEGLGNLKALAEESRTPATAGA